MYFVQFLLVLLHRTQYIYTYTGKELFTVFLLFFLRFILCVWHDFGCSILATSSFFRRAHLSAHVLLKTDQDGDLSVSVRRCEVKTQQKPLNRTFPSNLLL